MVSSFADGFDRWGHLTYILRKNQNLKTETLAEPTEFTEKVKTKMHYLAQRRRGAEKIKGRLYSRFAGETKVKIIASRQDAKAPRKSKAVLGALSRKKPLKHERV